MPGGQKLGCLTCKIPEMQHPTPQRGAMEELPPNPSDHHSHRPCFSSPAQWTQGPGRQGWHSPLATEEGSRSHQRAQPAHGRTPAGGGAETEPRQSGPSSILCTPCLTPHASRRANGPWPGGPVCGHTARWQGWELTENGVMSTRHRPPRFLVHPGEVFQVPTTCPPLTEHCGDRGEQGMVLPWGTPQATAGKPSAGSGQGCQP